MEMTENDKKKRYLFGYRYALRKQKVIEEEIRELRLKKMLPSLTQDGMPHGSGGSDMSGYAAKLDELLRDLGEQAQRCIDSRREIVEKIGAMQDETEKLVLRLRYIHGKKWEEIAVEMDYGYRNVLKLHGKALSHFEV